MENKLYTLKSIYENAKYNEIAYGLYEEKKSKFHCYIFNITNENEALNYISKIKNDNKTARHVVYIYSLKNDNNSLIKFSDDGEPQGTGTRAIYETLQKENITNVCIVIVRYFGGILLGAGPLSRAYLKSFKLASETCEKEVIYNYININFCTSYSNYDIIKNMLNNFELNKDIINFNSQFNDNVFISFEVKDYLYEELNSKLNKFMV